MTALASDEPNAPASPGSDVDPFADAAPPELARVRTGEDLDWRGIEAHLRTHLPSDLDLEGELEVLQFPNGAANLTYLVRFGPTELVLRRPPFGVLAPGAHDMNREFKVLSRLWPHTRLAPRALLFCDDASVAGADFFVMERRCGEVVRGVIPDSMRSHDDVGRRIGLALVDAMAELHLLDPDACALGDLGRPDGFVERQVRGWKKRWDLVAAPEHDTLMGEAHARLERTLPTPQRVSFVHNDLKLDNCMFDPADPDRVTSFFDWDMTTLGDPLVDLGTLLGYWPVPDDGSGRGSHAGMERMGLASRDALTRRYAERTRLDVSRAAWYEAFAHWKTATVVQQLHHRWVVGDSSDPRMETIAASVPQRAGSALRLLESMD